MQLFELGSCPVANLAPLATLQSLKRACLQRMPAVNLTPLVMLRCDLYLMFMEEPVDLSLLARTDHRLRVHVRNTATVGDPGHLVKIRKL